MKDFIERQIQNIRDQLTPEYNPKKRPNAPFIVGVNYKRNPGETSFTASIYPMRMTGHLWMNPEVQDLIGLAIITAEAEYFNRLYDEFNIVLR